MYAFLMENMKIDWVFNMYKKNVFILNDLIQFRLFTCMQSFVANYPWKILVITGSTQ